MSYSSLPEIKAELEQIAETIDHMATGEKPVTYEDLTITAELLDDSAKKVRTVRDMIVFKK